MKDSTAVKIGLAHIEAWSRHDWDKTKEMLAPDVRASVGAIQPQFRVVELSGVDDYMGPKRKAAQLIEPGSVEVLSTIGDETSALILIKLRIGLGPGGAMATLARSCLYRIDANQKIKEELDAFFVVSQ